MAESKHPDQAKREVIPTRESVPTKFHPYHDLLMVVPIPDIDHVGTIILPDKAKILMNEGHIIEKGPRCTDGLGIGDCVTWDANSEYRMNVDGVPFVLVREGVINMRIPKAELEAAARGEDLQMPIKCGARVNTVNGGLLICELPLGHDGAHVGPVTEGKDKEVYQIGSLYVCPACGETSDVSRGGINHAVGCPEDKRIEPQDRENQ